MREPKALILMYHRIGRVRRKSIVPAQYVTAGAFSRHLRLLRRLGFEGVSLARLKDGFEGRAPLPARPVAITFDDGQRNFHTGALPALRAQGLPATVFLVSNHIGGSNVWDQADGDVSEPLMTDAEIDECAAAGIDFGSHTRSHPHLQSCSPERRWEEIRGSKEALEERFGRPVDFFCYPYGHGVEECHELARRAGYRGATGCGKGFNDSATNPYAWRRIFIRSDTFAPIFVYKLWRALKRNR